ncbi:MAG: response regulator transcription factor [Lachnospiraceae bacterium]
MSLIYIVEDDENIREIESIALNNSGHDVCSFDCGKDFKRELAKRRPDLILLDIMLPDEDGMEILKKLRASADTRRIPVILVTAKSTELDKVKGLDIGADDYITKPFGVMELISRVRALIRRSMDSGASKSLRVGSIFLDSDRHMVYVDDEAKELTFKEYELLRCLMSNSGVAMHRDRIMELVWGTDFEGESRTLDMHIKTLRQKLGTAGSMIKTVRNVGYVLEE